jgi:hypothetical protein
VLQLPPCCCRAGCRAGCVSSVTQRPPLASCDEVAAARIPAVDRDAGCDLRLCPAAPLLSQTCQALHVMCSMRSGLLRMDYATCAPLPCRTKTCT